jgi:hypothetical protein
LIVDHVGYLPSFEHQNQLAGIAAGDRHSIFPQPPVETQNLFRSAIPSPHALILFPFGIEHLKAFRQQLHEIVRNNFQFQGRVDDDLQSTIIDGRRAQIRLTPIQ